MAEIVERNLEDSLGEVLHIKKTKLFTKSEINEIIRKRRQHEYALQKRNKRVLDFDAYITTELTILKLLRFRRQKTDDHRYIDKVERSIISRLSRLHRQLCYRFQSRIDVWIRFIRFCTILGRHISTARLWNRLLQVHGRTDPRLWAAAASYHLHQNAKAKIRTSIRKLRDEAREAAEQRRKLQGELKTLTRFLSKKKQNKISTAFTDMRDASDGLEKSMQRLNRERRLAQDRITLHSIREARRLLTEGLTLNPQCQLLLIELAKLEACAADFFRTRITSRAESVSSSVDKPGSVDLVTEIKETPKKSSKTRKGTSKLLAEDSAIFMSDVIEDVPFVASGQAFRLVANSILDQLGSDRAVTENLQKLVTSLPFLADDALNARLSTALEKLESQPSQSLSKEERIRPSKSDLQSLLDERAIQLYRTVHTDGVSAALKLWDSWFTSSEPGCVRNDRFRYLDPELREAVALLRLRLMLGSLQTSWSHTEQTDADRRVIAKEVTCQTRTWLDALATSHWGQKSPDFWISYVEFERDYGDCTRIPAVQWRASKTLIAQAYDKFTNLLNSSY